MIMFYCQISFRPINLCTAYKSSAVSSMSVFAAADPCELRGLSPRGKSN